MWLAIDDADEENAAMQFIPGTHKAPLPWIRTAQKHAVLTNEILEGDFQHFEAEFGKYVNAMPAGFMSLHADLLVHGSAANQSHRRRCGLTLRYCASDCRPAGYDEGLRGYAGQAILCSGNPGIWAADGMHVGRPEGEDWRPLDAEQIRLAQAAAR
eukprot:SAG31_NODE_3281_length_4468_cov_56.874571_2_plen_156_part_00